MMTSRKGGTHRGLCGADSSLLIALNTASRIVLIIDGRSVIWYVRTKIGAQFNFTRRWIYVEAER